MKRGGVLLLSFALLAPTTYGAQPPGPASAIAIAEAMRQARYSDGFAVRMNITMVTPAGQRSLPVKLSVVGQTDAARARLVIRAIAPERLRGRFIAAERLGSGPIRALAYRESAPDESAAIDPFAKLFDSDLILWDLFAPWWNWPGARLIGTAQSAGDECVNVRSPSDTGDSPIREVVSCVDPARHLSLRTQLFDARHTVARTIVVEETMRKESGRIVARKLSITGADRVVTEIEIYSGDDDYTVPAGTFAVLDAAAAAGNQADHATPR